MCTVQFHLFWTSYFSILAVYVVEINSEITLFQGKLVTLVCALKQCNYGICVNKSKSTAPNMFG